MNQLIRFSLLLALSFTLACSDDDGPADARVDARVDSGEDTGGEDSGPEDTGTGDSGGEDAAADASDDASEDAAADASDDAAGDASDDAAGDAEVDASPDAGPACTPTTSCGPDRYCDYTPNACGEETDGVCSPRPELCTDDCPGVCGCDGSRFCNACMAAAAGIDVDDSGTCMEFDPCAAMRAAGEGDCELLAGYAFDGSSCNAIICECVGVDCDRLYDDQRSCEAATRMCAGEACGGLGGAECADDTTFCEYESCRAPDSSGVCVEVPRDCVDTFPGAVCGCDGITYTNRCEARRARMTVAREGACDAGASCGGFGGMRCEPGEFCSYEPGDFCGAADAPGSCRRVPDLCTGEVRPVCGCDGMTYANACQAAMARTGVFSEGECRG